MAAAAAYTAPRRLNKVPPRPPFTQTLPAATAAESSRSSLLAPLEVYHADLPRGGSPCDDDDLREHEKGVRHPHVTGNDDDDIGLNHSNHDKDEAPPPANQYGPAESRWQKMAGCVAYTALGPWREAMIQLVHHPERNSSNILRADVVLDEREPSAPGKSDGQSDGDGGDGDGSGRRIGEPLTVGHFDSQTSSSPLAHRWRRTRRIVRRLLARNPEGHASGDMLQCCSFWEAGVGINDPNTDVDNDDNDDDDNEDASESASEGLVVYTTLIGVGNTDAFSSVDELLSHATTPTSREQVPIYHPAVLALAFTYRGSAATSGGGKDDRHTSTTPAPVQGTLGLEVLPLPGPTTNATTTATATATAASLQRVSTSLLKTAHIHAWGHAHAYTPRVPHDRLVSRELFQDVYLVLKARWAAFLLREWREGTDPAKHVHEDLAVAAWLICFWRGRSRRGDPLAPPTPHLSTHPWTHDTHNWPRPSGGFVDVGCGNGLLVWLLNNEGYAGYGFDLRPRKSWKLFQQVHRRASGDGHSVPADLRVHALDAMQFIHGLVAEGGDDDRGGNTACARLPPTSTAAAAAPVAATSPTFPANCFLIGNHADELTPVLPLLAAALPTCAGLINIPCCPWKLEGQRFTAGHYRVSRDEVCELLGGRSEGPKDDGNCMELEWQMDELGLGPAVDDTHGGSDDRQAAHDGSHKHTQAQGTHAQAHAPEGGSRNIAYLTYISHLHLLSGWLVEKEALRIPSTKNWAVVSTRRVGEQRGLCEGEERGGGTQSAATRARIRSLVQGPALAHWKARDAAGEGKWFLTEEPGA